MHEFVQAQLNLSPKELQQRVNTFGKQLQTTLDTIAAKRHAVLLVQEVAIAGAEDLTSLGKQQLMQLQHK